MRSNTTSDAARVDAMRLYVGELDQPVRAAFEQPVRAEDVLSIEELARRFNVSTKTISRWRDHGLVAELHDRRPAAGRLPRERRGTVHP